ncbi:hypothetical protein ES965_14380 [Bacillus subtilis]|uniref:hypothetical protein n=1 Tax=Bacillus subtilis TaxID=1423 RepID=UPI00100A00D2|nr:hypothetical protein [Bacillus subtilis]QAV85196.1 hypothetical protein ES965_14380 [Bacillus subtilis]WJD91306.1 hypothetical protein QR321_14325 [Bacillus spizizenii]
MIENAFPATMPCGNIFLYPPQIASQAIQEEKHSVFMIHSHKSDQSYIATTYGGMRRMLEFVYPISGSPEEITEIYAKIPWDEAQISSENGGFYYKQAPSVSAMKEYYDQLISNK